MPRARLKPARGNNDDINIMAKDWIHRGNAELLAQAQYFSAAINADPLSWGVQPAEAADLAARFADYAAAFARAADAATRTRGAIAARNETRRALTGLMRALGARIRANPAIDSAARLRLSLTVPGGAAAGLSSAAPASRPFVMLRRPVGNLLAVRLADEPSSHRFARPRHVSGAEVLFHPGPRPPADPRDWRPGAITLCGRATVRLPWLAPGTRVWVIARWFDGRGRSGPVSQPVSEYVGGMMAA